MVGSCAIPSQECRRDTDFDVEIARKIGPPEGPGIISKQASQFFPPIAYNPWPMLVSSAADFLMCCESEFERVQMRGICRHKLKLDPLLLCKLCHCR